MKFFSYLILSFCTLLNALAQDSFSVGDWREHLPHSKIKELAIINDIYYASTPFSLVEFNKLTNEITKYSTVNGLNEVGIASIAANEHQNTLIIGYESSNIDLLKDGEITNISSILNSNITGDKSIYEMVCKDRYVYVCTGFGIVVIDLNRIEVKDTYIIGENNSQLKVNDVYISNDSIFALTDFGVKSAPLNSLFLSDANSWRDVPVPPNISLEHLEAYKEDFLAYGEHNTILKYNNGNWDTLINNISQELINVRFINNNLLTCTKNNITVYDQNMDTVTVIFSYSGQNEITPNDVHYSDAFYWIADEKKGLRKVYNNWSSEPIVDGGPYTNEVFHLAFDKKNLFVSAGRTYGTNWNRTYNWHGIFQFDKTSWLWYNQSTISLMAEQIDTISDLIWTTPHHTTANSFYASSFGGGLLYFNNGELLERYSYFNSSLQSRYGVNTNNTFVAATDFDNEGNLWVSNPFTASPLSVMSEQGEWKSFFCGNAAINTLCTDLVVDNQLGYVWMIINGTGILVYDFNQTPLDETDDQYKIIGTVEGAGNLPSSFVNCLAIDHDGEMWIGTDQGPAVFYNPSSIFSDLNYDVQNILIDTSGTLQYLLENEDITDILIDGANRKWISTHGGGLFLMSEDGTQTVFSFYESNSPLFSDNITSLAMDDNSGELFIGTDKGLMGFRSTATFPEASFQSLEVFPNPVRPGYSGYISVSGMMNNSEIKITNSNGILIKTIFSNGGQAVWDGKNEFNEQVKSGVYYFFATSQDGNSKAKTKVLVIR